MELDSSNVFSVKNQDICVEEILSTLKNDNLPQSSFKVDFNLSKGKMLIEEEHNTVLSFDTKENTSLRNVLNYVCEIEDITKEDITMFDDFRKNIISKLNSDKSKEKLRDIIRDKMFKNTSKELVPIGIINVIDIEISDLPDVDYVLVIKKMTPPNYQSTPISDDLFKEKYATGEDFNEIVKRKKASGDHRYKYVDEVEQRKSFFEITIPIHADYSLKEMAVEGNDS